MFRRTFMLLATATLIGSALLAQAPAERIDRDVNARIRKEGMENSQILRTMHYLTDVYGPRLTGSPNHENAAKWAVEQMARWGFTNGHLEPFPFAPGGWLNVKASGHILSPVRDNLVFEVLAWTPSTSGTVTRSTVLLVPPDNPTQAELDAHLARMREQARDAIVLVGPHRSVPFQETPPAKRRDDAQVRAQYNPDPNAPAGRGGRGGRGGPAGPGRGGRGAEAGGVPRLSANEVNQRVNAFLLDNGVAVRVEDAGREHGQIRAFGAPGYRDANFDATKSVPTVVLRNEDYGRIVRILADGTPVTLEFTIENRWYPEGRTSYNAVAEIPGTNRADEVVMLGGHLDSWHSATGATDNAIGCAVMMEAARILQAIGVKPRRTIRVALWGGEEQGLLGSQAYVAEHFGTAEQPKPEFARFNGYFNVDSGTGRIRGGSVFGPPEAAAVVHQYLAEFEDLGIYGATATTSRNRGGTDSTSFNAAGLPGIGLQQDPIEYNSHTWHTNLDTWERIVEEDVRKSAVAIASAVYHVAMRDQMLPRFAPNQMPAPAGGGRGGQ